MGVRYLLYGVVIDFLWCSYGCHMDVRWSNYRYIVELLWMSDIRYME